MAAKNSAKARNAARRQRDKWKAKRWFSIRAPRHPWNYQMIGETLGETEDHIKGRIYEMTQQEFDGDFTKMHVKLRFRVTDVVGGDALTQFVGHEHQSDSVRRQIRRHRGKIVDVVDVITNDGYLVRMKPMLVTEKRIASSLKSDIRVKVAEIIRQHAAGSTYADLQKAVLGAKLEDAIRVGVKSMYPVRSCFIRKSQLLQTGVTNEKGPTLDEIHAGEARAEAEAKARKAAALAAAGMDVADETDEVADEDVPEEAPTTEPEMEVVTADEQEPEAEAEAPSEDAEDLSSLTVAQLKERLKAAGLPVSGAKAVLIERLQGA